MNKNHYNEALDALIKLAGFELLEEKALDMPPDKMIANLDVNFDQMDKKVNKMIRSEIAKHRFTNLMKVMKRVAAIFVVVIFISAIATMSSQALRVKFLNLFHSSSGVSTEISISEDNVENDDNSFIVPGYMPEGYELVETNNIETMFISTYKDSNNYIIRIEQIMDGYEATVDNERYDCFETEVLGNKVFIMEKGSKNIVTFNTSQYGFVISGSIDISELIKIVESILY